MPGVLKRSQWIVGRRRKLFQRLVIGSKLLDVALQMLITLHDIPTQAGNNAHLNDGNGPVAAPVLKCQSGRRHKNADHGQQDAEHRHADQKPPAARQSPHGNAEQIQITVRETQRCKGIEYQYQQGDENAAGL